jgi:hypothetical protein
LKTNFLVIIFVSIFISSCAPSHHSVSAEILPGNGEAQKGSNQQNLDQISFNYWCQLTADEKNVDVQWNFDKKDNLGWYASEKDTSLIRKKNFTWTLVGSKLTIMPPNGLGKPLWVTNVEFKQDTVLGKNSMIWTEIVTSNGGGGSVAASADPTAPPKPSYKLIECDARP